MGRPLERTERVCKRCKKTFLFKNSQAKHYLNAGSFCSEKCSHSFTYTCKGCDKVRFDGYVAHQSYCNKKCKYKAKDKDPIAKKAFTMSSPITFGKGKTEFFNKLLRQNLGNPCRYCKEILTLDTVGLDHIVPFASTKNRTSKQFKRQLDVAENLQIICKNCNSMKSNLPHDKFVKLIAFMEDDLVIGEHLKRKLAQSNILWQYKRKSK